VITSINNTAVTDSASLSDALLNLDPGSTATIGYTRGTQAGTANLKLGEM